MPSLFPTFEVPTQLAEDVHLERLYRPGPLWDLEKGDFIFDGARRPLYGSGYDEWVTWCIKAIMTERWGHYGYSGDMGIEAEDAFKQPDRKAQESALIRTITEALLADPMGRTRQVRDFQFKWYADELEITCVIYGNQGDSNTLKVKLRNF